MTDCDWAEPLNNIIEESEDGVGDIVGVGKAVVTQASLDLGLSTPPRSAVIS